MLQIDAKILNYESLVESLTDLEKNQLPFIISRTLTQSAIKTRNAIRDDMRSIFDAPTRFTLNSMLISAARKDKLEAKVYYDEFAPKGKSAAEYLKPNAYGGQRNAKRFEKRLRDRGILKSDEFVVPSNSAPKNQYGNVSAGTTMKILSAFQSTFDTQQRSSTFGKTNERGKRKHSGTEYFVGSILRGQNRLNLQTQKGRAIYKRTRNSIEPIFFITDKAPTYNAIFDFDKLAEQHFNECINAEFEAAFAYAMSSMKITSKDRG
jgi:hypothetical protein